MSIRADADGLAYAIGDVCNTAIQAYHSNEESREGDLQALRKELADSRDREAELQTSLDQLKLQLEAAVSAIRQLPIVRFDLFDIAGAWYAEELQSGVTVTQVGMCSFDNGDTQWISMSDGNLFLAGTHVLSVTQSSRKRLIWEGEPTLTWTPENRSGSSQLMLTLDVTEVLLGSPPNHAFIDKKPQSRFSFHFSIVGCDVDLVLCRNRRGKGGTMVEGDQFLGVLFGLRKTGTKVSHPQQSSRHNDVDAMNCTTRIEFWDVSKNAWVQAVRTVGQRYEAGSAPVGDPEALTFANFRQIVGPATGERYHLQRFLVIARVTVVDIGCFEVTRNVDTPLGPILE